MWNLIVSVPDHCLSFYFSRTANKRLVDKPDKGKLNRLIFLKLKPLESKR